MMKAQSPTAFRQLSQRQPPRQVGGFTLVEIMLVIGISAVLLLAAFVIYPKVKSAAVIRSEVSDLTHIITTIKQLQSMTPGGNTRWIGSNNMLVYYRDGSDAFIPSHMIQRDANGAPINGSRFINRFGGDVRFYPGTGRSQCSSAMCRQVFVIYDTDTGMDSQQCIKFVEGVAPFVDEIVTHPGGGIKQNGTMRSDYWVIRNCTQGDVVSVQIAFTP